jgi:hypothetical protein
MVNKCFMCTNVQTGDIFFNNERVILFKSALYYIVHDSCAIVHVHVHGHDLKFLHQLQI